MFLAYRIGYFIIVVLFFANILGTQYLGVVPAATSVLKLASTVVLCGNLVLVVAFSRIQTIVFWVAISVWQVLFVWYAWLSPAAPFAVVLRDRALAAGLFALLSAWFYSLPVVRTLHRSSGLRVEPGKSPCAGPATPSRSQAQQ